MTRRVHDSALQLNYSLSLLMTWGRPNFATIIESSMHTAPEVEFGNFLTMMYFEQTSAAIISPSFSSRINLWPRCAMEMGVVPGLSL